jgi:hypothetical protein
MRVALITGGMGGLGESISTKEPLINLRIMAHCAFDSRAAVWTGS